MMMVINNYVIIQCNSIFKAFIKHIDTQLKKKRISKFFNVFWNRPEWKRANRIGYTKQNKRRQRFFLCHPPCDVEFFIIIDICRFVIIVHVLQALPRAIDKNDLVFFLTKNTFVSKQIFMFLIHKLYQILWNFSFNIKFSGELCRQERSLAS